MAKPEITPLLKHLQGNEDYIALTRELGIEDPATLASLGTHEANYQTVEPTGILKEKLDAVNQRHETHGTAAKKLEKAVDAAKPAHQKELDEVAKRLKEAGGSAHAHMDELTARTNRVVEAGNKHINDLEVKLVGLSGEEADAATAALKREKDLLEKVAKRSKSMIDDGRKVVEEKTKVKPFDAKLTVSSVAESAEKAAKEAKVGMFKRIGNNWSHGGAMGKAKVAIGSIGALGLAISGIRDMSSKQGEDGKTQQEAKPLLGVFKIAAGGGLGLWLATHGGAKGVTR